MHRLDVAIAESLIAQPVLEPIDLDQVKKHLRWTATSEDSLIDVSISAARQYFEERTARQCLAATWEVWLDCWPDDVIELPHPPLLGVESVTYVTGDGDDVELFEGADFHVVAPSGPYAKRGYLERVDGITWPTTSVQSKAIRVRFVAGYGFVSGDVPELVKAILFLLVGNFHKYRSDTVETKFQSAFAQLPLGVDAFLRDFALSSKTQRPMRRTLSWG